MALQTSGAISLNEIHLEAGGSSGTTASINDADIRGLIGKGSGVTMSFNEWYGASSSIDQDTITVGYRAPSGYLTGAYGYEGAPFYTGSMSNGLWDGGYYPAGAYFGSFSYTTSNVLFFRINWSSGTPSSGATTSWNNVKIGSTNYTRASATFNASSNYHQWSWYSQTFNPIGTTVGANVVVTFT